MADIQLDEARPAAAGPVHIALKLMKGAVRDTDPAARAGALVREAGGEPVAAGRPLFESLEPDALAALEQRAARIDPTYVPAGLASWWQVEVPTRSRAIRHDAARSVGPDVQAVLRRLHAHPDVESAFGMRPGPPPTVHAVDDPRSASQVYLDAAPDGIDARYVWGFPGGDGSTIGFVDVEQGWNLNHEDLAGAGVSIISGTNSAYFYHGTSVLGEVLMVDNTVGGVGIAPSCTGRVVSQHRPSGSYNTPDAILDAVAHMTFGDVLLLEAQEFDPVGGQYLWPVEIVDATFDAIRLATALGVVVVEAGCNGGYDLDAYLNSAGKAIFNRSSVDFRDSGAVMVGAGSAAAPHSRLSFSNFGSRIDCYGWGEQIDTTTTDTAGTDNTQYTTGFSGTSGASPIVVGAALCLQGLAHAGLGYRFSPRELRRLLVDGGTASATPSTDRIGVMPNLRAVIDGHKLNLAPDIYLRDYVGDTGNPTGGAVSASPDIIVRQAAVADPQGSFGTGSGTENDPNLSQAVVAAHDHTVYVRLSNRGGSPAPAVSVDVYWSEPATLVSPNLWHLIGTATAGSVLNGPGLTVAGAVPWPAAAVPGAGHYCFVAVAGSPVDPAPTPASFPTWNDYVTYVEANNNVAWRNFNVTAPPSGGAPPSFKEAFVVPGAFDAARPFRLETMGRLPRNAEVVLEIPLALAKALGQHDRSDLAAGREHRTARVRIHPFGVQDLGTAMLAAKSIARCRLLVRFAEPLRKQHYELAIRQLEREREVGRITWRFGAAD